MTEKQKIKVDLDSVALNMKVSEYLRCLINNVEKVDIKIKLKGDK